MPKQFTDDDDALLAELGVEVEEKKASSRTLREERIIAGFEEIQRFVEEHGRLPQHGEDRDIFERLYAVRLDRIRELEEGRSHIELMDHQGLLTGATATAAASPDDMDDDALLAELGVEAEKPAIAELKHVRSHAEKKAAEEIANREPCLDFERFKPLFQQVKADIQKGVRSTRDFVRDTGFSKAEIRQGQFFILGGQMVYVAEVGETMRAPNGDLDARLRVIYANGTESNLLLRSLQRALYKDEEGRRITEPSAGPLFDDKVEEGDQESGTIYVLRSHSNHPLIAEHRTLIHKIGVTSTSLEQRLAGAHQQPTYLMAEVEVLATYELFNINRTKLEKLIHRLFAPARLDIEIKDRFGMPVVPQEWFLVPLHIIDEAVQRIQDGTIAEYVYDPQTASLKLQA